MEKWLRLLKKMQMEEYAVIVVANVHVVASVVKKDVVQGVKLVHKKILCGSGIISKKDVKIALELGVKGIIVQDLRN